MFDLKLDGKKVIVLASSKGIGKEIAKQYSAQGASVIVTGRTESILNNTAKEIEMLTDKPVFPVVTDITNSEDLKNLITTAKETLGSIDVLINNSGGPPVINFETASDQLWFNAFELTIMSYVRAMKAILPLMKRQQGGRIVNIASSSVKEPINELLLSNVFRNGIQALSKTLSKQYAKKIS